MNHKLIARKLVDWFEQDALICGEKGSIVTQGHVIERYTNTLGTHTLRAFCLRACSERFEKADADLIMERVDNIMAYVYVPPADLKSIAK